MSVEWMQEITAERGDWHCAAAFGLGMRVRPGRSLRPRPTDDEERDARPDGWVWSLLKSGDAIASGWCKTYAEATAKVETEAREEAQAQTEAEAEQ
jgi:hypothetical protein